jgi:hypothetical protein
VLVAEAAATVVDDTGDVVEAWSGITVATEIDTATEEDASAVELTIGVSDVLDTKRAADVAMLLEATVAGTETCSLVERRMVDDAGTEIATLLEAIMGEEAGIETTTLLDETCAECVRWTDEGMTGARLD